MQDTHITTIKDAQKLVKQFAERNGWKDLPNIDKFDHLHEELIEMSQHLRYKSEDERIKIIKEKADYIFWFKFVFYIKSSYRTI